MKKVLALSLLGLSINCFAGEMVAPGVEKLYETHTVTGENFISGHYVSEGSDSFFFNTLLTAQTQQYSGYVGKNILMTAYHTYTIVNQTQSKQSYRLRTWLCTNKNDCSDHQIGYNLEPGSKFIPIANEDAKILAS